MGVDITSWNPRGLGVWFNLYAKVLDINEWVAPGSNNARAICPDMEIIPSNCIRGHCFLMSQCKCSSLSPWVLYRWLSHGKPRCITALSKIAGWSSGKVYSHCWPPISSTQSLASPHCQTIFLSMAHSSTIKSSPLLNAASEMVHLTLLTPRSLCDSRVGRRYSLHSLKSASVSQPWSPAPDPSSNVALNPDPLLIVDPGAPDPDGPWYRGRFDTDNPFAQSSWRYFLNCRGINLPLIFNFRSFTNLLVSSASILTSPLAYLDNWVNLWSYWETFI